MSGYFTTSPQSGFMGQSLLAERGNDDQVANTWVYCHGALAPRDWSDLENHFNASLLYIVHTIFLPIMLSVLRSFFFPHTWFAIESESSESRVRRGGDRICLVCSWAPLSQSIRYQTKEAQILLTASYKG